MSRSVRSFLPVVGDPAALGRAFDGDPQRWLPRARREGADTWRLTVYAGSLSRCVAATVGTSWRSDRTRWRTISWVPVDADGESTAVDRLLPSLDGELGLHIRRSGPATVVLDARYDPPGGSVGAAMDALALARVARGTVERFVQEVTSRLAAEAVLLGPSTDRSPAGDLPEEHGAGTVAP